MIKRNVIFKAGFLMIIGMTALSANAAVNYQGSSYQQFSDSPFAQIDFSSGYFYLENFEDKILNTPGVTMNGGIAGVYFGSAFADSVDEDDGIIDGMGMDPVTGKGWNWHSFGAVNTAIFKFDQQILGSLPTYVGIVWTDASAGYCDAIFSAYDSSNNVIDSFTMYQLGDGSNGPATAEDTFMGLNSSVGIARIEVTVNGQTDFSLDHLQYGHVPEPATMLMMSLGSVLCLRKKKNR